MKKKIIYRSWFRNNRTFKKQERSKVMTLSSLNVRKRFFYASLIMLIGLIFYLILVFALQVQASSGYPYQQYPQSYPTYPPTSIPPGQTFEYPPQQFPAGYPPQQSATGYPPQPFYTIQSQGMTQQPGMQFPQVNQLFKPIIETFPGSAQGWNDPKTTILDVKGNKVTVLGVFAGSQGKQALFKTFSLQGAHKFKVDVDFYFYKSWDGETLSVFFNDKAISQYKYSFQQPFSANKCKIVIDNIPFDTAYWPSRKVQCTYDGSFDNGKMTIEGQDVTNSSIPTSLKIGFGNNLDELPNNEGFALEQISITPIEETAPPAGALTTDSNSSQIPRRINITVLSPYPVPMTPGAPISGSYPFMPGSLPQQAPTPASAPLPQKQLLSQEIEPQFYPPSSQPPIEDRTAGFATDGITREGASKCAVCQSPNQDVRDTNFCLENCVTLPRQTILNMDRVNNETQQENERLKKELERYQTSTPEKKPPLPRRRRR